MFVVARNSTLQFSDRTKSHKEIAGALGVKYLLNGSIQRQAERLRIHTELVDVDRNRTVWAERYDGAGRPERWPNIQPVQNFRVVTVGCRTCRTVRRPQQVEPAIRQPNRSSPTKFTSRDR